MRENGALGALMSGSGSTTFALLPNRTAAETLAQRFKSKFGLQNWIAVVNA
jgi:4-diphosphocytidyl-2C-methyl-D-erythritol kinase